MKDNFHKTYRKQVITYEQTCAAIMKENRCLLSADTQTHMHLHSVHGYLPEAHQWKLSTNAIALVVGIASGLLAVVAQEHEVWSFMFRNY